jgi:hypothetical protein
MAATASATQSPHKSEMQRRQHFPPRFFRSRRICKGVPRDWAFKNSPQNTDTWGLFFLGTELIRLLFLKAGRLGKGRKGCAQRRQGGQFGQQLKNELLASSQNAMVCKAEIQK